MPARHPGTRLDTGGSPRMRPGGPTLTTASMRLFELWPLTRSTRPATDIPPPPSAWRLRRNQAEQADRANPSDLAPW
jgi:hypothetical protein